jgi:hypothetical protein
LVGVLDWSVVADWSVVELGLVIVDCWLADAPLVMGLTLVSVDDVDELPALMSVELELLLLGLLDEAPPFRFRLLELEELAGACDEPAPLRFRLVELDELDGVLALPGAMFTSVELDELPDVPATPGFTLIELELAPGTTAIPGVVTSVVVLLPDWPSGTLGTQPAGVVFAVSMHFGSRRSLLTLVMVSARATPNAARSDAARRLILKVFRFIALPPFWT